MAKKTTIHDLPVAWKNVSFGDKTVSIGFSMSRGKTSPAAIDKILTGKRLTCKLFAGIGEGEDNGQSRAFSDGDLDVEAVFDSSGFGVRSKRFTGTLSTTIASVDAATISHFAKRDGRIEVSAVEDIDEDAADDKEE